MDVSKRFVNGQLIEYTIDGIPQSVNALGTISNAIGAAFRLAAATMKGEKVRAAASEIDRRLVICRTCEFFRDNPMKCRKCGCYLNLKTRLETEHCPVGKW